MGMHDAILHWAHLLNTGIQFDVVVDHSALVFLATAPSIAANKRILNYLLHLQGFQFRVIYKCGKSHANADAISRLFRYNDRGTDDEFEYTTDAVHENSHHDVVTPLDLRLMLKKIDLELDFVRKHHPPAITNSTFWSYPPLSYLGKREPEIVNLGCISPEWNEWSDEVEVNLNNKDSTLPPNFRLNPQQFQQLNHLVLEWSRFGCPLSQFNFARRTTNSMLGSIYCDPAKDSSPKTLTQFTLPASYPRTLSLSLHHSHFRILLLPLLAPLHLTLQSQMIQSIANILTPPTLSLTF